MPVSYYDMEPEEYLDDSEMRGEDEERDCGNCCHLQLVGVNFGGFCGWDGKAVILCHSCEYWEAIH